MEIPVSLRGIWRGGIYFDLPDLLLIMGSPSWYASFHRPCQPVQRGGFFEKLAPEGTKWHWTKWIGIVGSYLLMMFYTTVGGWLLYYCFKSIKGDFNGASTEEVTAAFSEVMGNMPVMAFWTILICVIGFAVCVFGIQKGDRAGVQVHDVHSAGTDDHPGDPLCIHGGGRRRNSFLPGSGFCQDGGAGHWKCDLRGPEPVLLTLSDRYWRHDDLRKLHAKDRALLGEAVSITALDTSVALTAGFIIIPACFAFGIEPGSGPSLIFITIPNIFAQIPGGAFWGGLFFLFLTFAAFTTVVAVFENIISFDMDLFGWSRSKSVIVSAVLIILLSMPCVLGFNVLAGFQPLGEGSTIMDLEDFIVSNNLLPLGSLGYVLFCTRKNGWGWGEVPGRGQYRQGSQIPAWT